MLKQFVQVFDAYIYNDAIMYAAAAVGLCVFVGVYYLGEYLVSDRDPEPDFSPD